MERLSARAQELTAESKARAPGVEAQKEKNAQVAALCAGKAAAVGTPPAALRLGHFAGPGAEEYPIQPVAAATPLGCNARAWTSWPLPRLMDLHKQQEGKARETEALKAQEEARAKESQALARKKEGLKRKVEEMKLLIVPGEGIALHQSPLCPMPI